MNFLYKKRKKSNEFLFNLINFFYVFLLKNEISMIKLSCYKKRFLLEFLYNINDFRTT